MTKDQAFDLQSAAEAVGVRCRLFTNDRRASVAYGVTIFEIADLYKIGKQLSYDEGPLEVAVNVDEGRTQINIT